MARPNNAPVLRTMSWRSALNDSSKKIESTRESAKSTLRTRTEQEPAWVTARRIAIEAKGQSWGARIALFRFKVELWLERLGAWIRRQMPTFWAFLGYLLMVSMMFATAYVVWQGVR